MPAYLKYPIALIFIIFTGLPILSSCQQVKASQEELAGGSTTRLRKLNLSAQPLEEKSRKSSSMKKFEDTLRAEECSQPAPIDGTNLMDLPNEVLVMIFERLDIPGRMNFRCVSKQAQEISFVWSKSQNEVMSYLIYLWQEKVRKTVKYTSPILCALQEGVLYGMFLRPFSAIFRWGVQYKITCDSMPIYQRHVLRCINFWSELPSNIHKEKCLTLFRITHMATNYALPQIATCLGTLYHRNLALSSSKNFELENIILPWLNRFAILGVPVNATSKVQAQKDSLLRRLMERRPFDDIESLRNLPTNYRRNVATASISHAALASLFKGWLNSIIVRKSLEYASIEAGWLPTAVWGTSSALTCLLESDVSAQTFYNSSPRLSNLMLERCFLVFFTSMAFSFGVIVEGLSGPSSDMGMIFAQSLGMIMYIAFEIFIESMTS